MTDYDRTKRRPRIVIIGAGFGGLAAARALKRAAAEVIVVDRRNHHLFQPLLYQAATGTLSPAEIARPIRRILRRQGNAEVLLGEVRGIDLDHRTVELDDAAIGYDYLVVATGARFDYLGHPQWAEHAPGLKSLEDAMAIRHRILLAFERAEMATDEQSRQRCLSFILVGGGPTGVELAGAIADMAQQSMRSEYRHCDPAKARVVLMEAMPRLLGGMPEALAEYARRALERRDVEVRLDCPMEQVDAEGVVAEGERIVAATVIWTAGVAASAAGDWLGAETDKSGRVKVEADLSLPGHAEVFVIGDAALALDDDGEPLPGLAAVARQQGRHVGSLLGALVEGRADRPAFSYRDWGQLATVGRHAAVADLGRLQLKGWPAWWLWGAIHILRLVGFGNRVQVMIEWLWAYLTFRRGARVITG